MEETAVQRTCVGIDASCNNVITERNRTGLCQRCQSYCWRNNLKTWEVAGRWKQQKEVQRERAKPIKILTTIEFLHKIMREDGWTKLEFSNENGKSLKIEL
jgi:hypothetical protein